MRLAVPLITLSKGGASVCSIGSRFFHFTYSHPSLLHAPRWACDFLFYDAALLELAQAVPVPSRDVVAEHGMPSPTIPSDHFPVIADLRWR